MIVPYTRGRGLDIGCGPYKAWPHFIGVDSGKEHWGGSWRSDIFAEAESLSMFADRSLDFVFSSHLLEHMKDPAGVLREWWRVIKPNGYLVLYLPHAGLYPLCGEPDANPDHKHDFLPNDVVDLMHGISGWELVVNQERTGAAEYSFLQVYRKVGGSKRVDLSNERGKAMYARGAEKTCLIVRLGGFGDMIMASSVLPGLREQGYWVVFQTTPKGHNILREDPNVDEWWIQDHEQVPNRDLSDYWRALSHEFDRCINLSESVEGTLLALPDRRNHALPQAARHMTMNVNYLEFTHAIAEVPMPARPRFYPSAYERDKFAKMAKDYGPGPVVLWTLAGSSVHKAWPWVGNVIAWLMEKTDARVVLAGDTSCRVLEAAICQALLQRFADVPIEESDGWQEAERGARLKEAFGGRNRLICTSGAWPIRDTLAFAHYVDVVVGPETGVLNAVCMDESVAKVVMLSHSSHENLTRDWVKTIAIAPPVSVACYPCHRMHYNRDFCPEDEATGASACAAAIVPENVFGAIVLSI